MPPEDASTRDARAPGPAAEPAPLEERIAVVGKHLHFRANEPEI